MRRFFINNSMLNESRAFITGGEYNHIVNVLRLRAGDEIVLCLNDGFDNIARIESIDKKRVVASILRTEKNKAESAANCALFQALVKGDKLEFIAQKATELGANRIVPFVSEFSAVKFETSRAQRLHTACIEAAKQCGRAITPVIPPVLAFNDVVNELKSYPLVIFPYENEREMTILHALQGAQNQGARHKAQGKVSTQNAQCMIQNECQIANNEIKSDYRPPAAGRRPPIDDNCQFSVAIVVGGEGGFSQAEAEQLKAAGAVACSLGKRILRAETAAVVTAGIVMNFLEENMKKYLWP